MAFILGFGLGTGPSSGSEISAVVTSGIFFHLRARADAGDLVILLLPGLGFSGVDGADVLWPTSFADSFLSL